MTDREKVESGTLLNPGSSAPAFGYRRLVLLLCAVALGAYHIFASADMYPVPGGDAAVFMPAAINLKAGRGLTNSLWEAEPDPTGQHRYLDHPALFQLVVSACMWKSETRNAFIVGAIFDALTLALYAAILGKARFARRFHLLDSGACALGLLHFRARLFDFHRHGATGSLESRSFFA